MSELLAFIGGFAIALFAEPIRQWLFRARLTLEFTNADHFVTRTTESGGHQARYIRIKATNRSSRLAKSCRAYLVNIERLGPSGAWVRRPTTAKACNSRGLGAAMGHILLWTCLRTFHISSTSCLLGRSQRVSCQRYSTSCGATSRCSHRQGRFASPYCYQVRMFARSGSGFRSGGRVTGTTSKSPFRRARRGLTSACSRRRPV